MGANFQLAGATFKVSRRLVFIRNTGLPMNRPLSCPSGTLSPSEGERDGVRGLLAGSWSQCMRRNEREALHEPAGSGAGVRPAAWASSPRIHRGRDARADSRDGCPTTARPGFRVPMHPKKRKGAFQEARAAFSANHRQPTKPSNRLKVCTQTGRSRWLQNGSARCLRR